MSKLPELQIEVLGTGTSQGVPVIGCSCQVCQSQDPADKRLRTSVLVRSPHTSLVIDAGPDFRQQMLRLSVSKLDSVVLTHGHKDHTAGLDDVRAFNWIQKKPMDIYASEDTLEAVKREIPYAFGQSLYPGVPDIRLILIDRIKAFSVGDIRLIPLAAWHHKMPVLGFRMGDFSYLTDANSLEKGTLEKMKGSSVVIINALRQSPHHSHFSLSQALDIIKELSPAKAYITHISHQMGLSAQVQQSLPEGVALAFDGLCFKAAYKPVSE